MNQTSTKPQIVPRKSLLKKKDSNSLDSNLNDSKNGDSNNIIIKPALPVKPAIISKKPQISSNKLNNDVTVVNNLINHQVNDTIVNNSNDNEITTSTTTTTTLSKKKIDIIQHHKSSPIKLLNNNNNKNRIKFRLTTNDLNRLRLRKDFDDKNIDNQSNNNNNLIIYDIREDQEQIKKLNEICELLVAAGYFRARIKGLHNFDKVIGGMCWAIQMCNIDLDIDIFYKENLQIGQKIALTEKIVRVLQKMKCPFKLEPHQIQGMDCIHIYPAIQWLVKKSLETRQQMSNYVRKYSNWQFERTFINDDCNKNKCSSLAVIMNNDNNDNIDELIDPIKYNLQRRFFHPNRNKLKDETIRIRTTLLEYGIIINGNEKILITNLNNDNTNDVNISNDNDNDNDEKQLLQSMTKTDEDYRIANAEKVPTSIVAKMIIVNEQQSNEIKRLAEDYEKKKSSLNTTTVDNEFIYKETKLKSEILSKRREYQKLITIDQSNQNEEKLNVLKEKLKMINEKFNELNDENNDNENENDKNEKIQLTELLNVLRKQKIELKQHCRLKKQQLEKQIEEIQLMNQKQQSSINDKDNDKKIDNELQIYNERHLNVNKELSLINKKYAIIQRKFDEIPNRTELSQYQKRFIELYNQLSAKHNETKKFYTMYNNLSDERMYLEKEFNLINSILENFQKASIISTPMIKNEFLIKFQQTIDSINENRQKIGQKLQNEKDKREQLNQRYQRLIEEQRLYFIAVKSFKEECKINEQLIVQLDKINKK